MLVPYMHTLGVKRASITHSDTTKSLNVIQLLSQPDIFNSLVSILPSWTELVRLRRIALIPVLNICNH